LGESAVSEALDDFDPVVFFVAFLPPIIFNSGYHCKQDAFISNLGVILALAFIGTLLSALVIAGIIYGASEHGFVYSMSFPEILSFSSLLSATDPVSTLAVLARLNVEPNVFYIIFGESVFNDAVSLTLFDTTSKFIGFDHDASTIYIAILDFAIIFVSSTLIGILSGVLTALLFKSLEIQDRVVEICVFLLLMYIPFLFAQALGVSGIVAILFMGIAARRYVRPRLSEYSQYLADEFSRVLSHGFEAAVFLNLGLTVFNIDDGSKKMDMAFWALFACLVSRGVLVSVIVTCVNCLRRTPSSTTRPITFKESILIWFAGLRGAVAYAAASLFPDVNGNRAVVKSATMIIVIVTVFVMGGLTEDLCRVLKIPTNPGQSPAGDRVGFVPNRGGLHSLLLSFEKHCINPLLGKPRSAALLDNPGPAGMIEMAIPERQSSDGKEDPELQFKASPTPEKKKELDYGR